MRNTLACREACSELSLTPQGTGAAGEERMEQGW